MKFEMLKMEAQLLGTKKNTEWAEDHAELYDAFDESINAEYDMGNLTDDQFNELALIAFYDYDDLKGDE